VRDEVNRLLEAARQDKTIGTSLGAMVVLRARGETLALLERHASDLPTLFIVSQVSLEPAPPEAPELDITVTRADGIKCPRCWRTVGRTSTAPETEGLCERCVEALEASGANLAR
jgi:isoleucyl-tRNA synthetase